MKLIECPRDAMQGIHDFIPTEVKVNYINQLLKVGFHTLDFGSFVSPKAIPQMKDTAEVLSRLDLEDTKSKLLAIVANERGAEDALKYNEIDFLGYPFSVSETFQQRNTNASLTESVGRVEAIQNRISQKGKELVLYLSMGFGNPYGDPYHPDIVAEWIQKLSKLDITIFALSDTIGIAKPHGIKDLFKNLIPEFPSLELGAHLHSTPDSWKEKIEAAYQAGCRRYDGAILGYGGCPMAEDELTGNMPTEGLVSYMTSQKVLPDNFSLEEFEQAKGMASELFQN